MTNYVYKAHKQDVFLVIIIFSISLEKIKKKKSNKRNTSQVLLKINIHPLWLQLGLNTHMLLVKREVINVSCRLLKTDDEEECEYSFH